MSKFVAAALAGVAVIAHQSQALAQDTAKPAVETPATTEPAAAEPPGTPPAAGAAAPPAATAPALPPVVVQQKKPSDASAKSAPKKTAVDVDDGPPPKPRKSVAAKPKPASAPSPASAQPAAASPATSGTGSGSGATPIKGITATGPSSTGYTAPAASVGTKTNTPILETPMTVEVIPQQILKDQGIASQGLGTTLGYLGVQTGGWGAQGELLTFRGFATSTTLWNGFRIEEGSPTSFQVNGGVWMENVERLEVLKGPSSAFYGRAEPGGSVNVVTRKPESEFHAVVNTGISSWNGHREAIDITGPVDAAKTLLFRLNLADEQQDSWYRYGPKYVSQGIAPALTWRITPQTTLSFEGQYRHLEGNSGQPYVPIDLSTGRLVPVDPRNTLLPGNRAEFDQNRTMISLDHKFDGNWSASLKYMHNDADSPYNGSNFPYFFNFPIVGGSLDTWLFTGFTNTRQITDATMLDIMGRFTTAGLKHTLVVGADYYSTRFNQIAGFDFAQTTDYFNPSNPLPVPATDTWTKRSSDYSFYFQDQIELPWNWFLIAGGRYQSISDHSFLDSPSLGLPAQDIAYENRVFLPRGAVLWKFLPWMSTYYGYAEGVGANSGIDSSGRPLVPESSKQHEVGLKSEFMGGRLRASAAVFELTKLNVASADPLNPNFNISVGEVRSTGYEFTLQGALTSNWNVLFNYSHARPYVVVGADAGSAFTGTTIVAGQLLPFVSTDTVSLWTSYKLPGELLSGWTVGGGVQWSSAPTPADGSLIPTKSYTVASAFAAYETRIAGLKTTIKLNVDNLFDERYLLSQGDIGRADPVFGNVLGGNWGAPRQFRFNLRTEF